jgi:uncharacterized protein
MSGLAAVARRCDETVARARADLVWAVRDAARSGMTQVEIAEAIGRSQPEVSRLMRFHGTTPLAMRLRTKARDVKETFRAAGGRDVRVFGSVARGDDRDDSDIDLLFTPTRTLSLLELEALAHDLSDLLGVNVDVLPDDAVRPALRDRIAKEAIPL